MPGPGRMLGSWVVAHASSVPWYEGGSMYWFGGKSRSGSGRVLASRVVTHASSVADGDELASA